MTESGRGSGSGRESALVWALLLLAIGSATTVLCVWARGTGSRVPDSADIAQAEVDRAGGAEELSAVGAHTGAGAVLLTLAFALMAVALWRLSPRYRPAVAGYVTIGCGFVGILGVLWFVLDADHRLSAFGSSVQMQSDTVQVSVWPWVTLGCFAAACAVGVALVPGAQRDDSVVPAGHDEAVNH